jgi:hypothetical protein
MVVMGARIEEHPILGKQEKGRLVTFYFDGKELTGYEGEPIAAALKAQGVMIHRYTKKEHKPRGIFCIHILRDIHGILPTIKFQEGCSVLKDMAE